MAYIPPNSNGVNSPAGSSPVVLPSATAASASRTLASASNYEFLTNTTNGWYDANGYNWVSLSVIGHASAAGSVYFEATNETITGAQTDAFLQDTATANPSRTNFYTITANTVKIFEGNLPARYFRVRVNSGSAGTASVYATFRQSPTPTQAPVIGSIVTGPNQIGSVLTGISSVADLVGVSASGIGSFQVGNIISLGAMSTPAASFNVNVTSVTGTSPTFDLAIQESYDSGANWVSLFQFERITTTGQLFTPALRINGNAIRYYSTNGGLSPSMQVSITRHNKSFGGHNLRTAYDRTFNTSQTLNQVGTSFYVQGTNRIQAIISSGTINTPTGLTWYVSMDNVNFAPIGNTMNTVANIAIIGGSIEHNYKWARLQCTSAGNQTINYIYQGAQGN